MKKLLLVNGSINDVPLVEAAHSLGYYVITSGNDSGGPAHLVSDEHHLVNYADKEAMLALARRLDIDAVCSCGNDICALTAAFVAQEMGLSGHDAYEVSRVFHEKDVFRATAEELDLPVPKSMQFDDESSAVALSGAFPYPVMVKPVDSCSGRGVSKVDSLQQFEAAASLAFDKSLSKRIVVEEYIEGTQHGFICFVHDGKVVFDYSTNDYEAPANPWLVLASFGHPADGYESMRNRIIDDVERLARQTGMADGFLTIQYMVRNGKPVYLETMRRVLGNYHFAALSRETDVDWYEWFISCEAGNDCRTYWENANLGDCCAGFIGVYGEENGCFDSLSIDSRFEEDVFDEVFFVKQGEKITDYANQKIAVLLFACTRGEKNEFIHQRNRLVKVNMR